jgi:hypothetical protein
MVDFFWSLQFSRSSQGLFVIIASRPLDLPLLLLVVQQFAHYSTLGLIYCH